MNVGSLHLQHHVLEGVKLKEAVGYTIVAEAYRVPVGALHWFSHDGPVPDLTSHPPKDRIRENCPRAES